MNATSKSLVALALATALVSVITPSQQAQAQTFTTLYSFCSKTDCSDGQLPEAGLIQATNGDLYGTTAEGGAKGVGTVFKITPGGRLTTLYTFCSTTDCSDGQLPEAGLIQATNGDLYGTTVDGGAKGDGTVFKITPGGTLTTLHSFCSQTDCSDGSAPYAALIQVTNGDLYGTTELGGSAGTGSGTVFKITPGGTLTTLYSFDSTDGSEAGLIQATNGDLYGTTFQGGANGEGSVFKITPDGTLTTLYSFCSKTGCTDGGTPMAALIQATNGDLYGTTEEYGGATGDGTVFKITPGGTLTTPHSFDSTDGAHPFAGLIQATNGDLYGTTVGGGNGYGTVFKITTGGKLTTLYSFDSTGGTVPTPMGLIQATNGDLYGTTAYGGVNGDGTVFRLSVGLGPFVETQTTSGKVGAAVKILGTDLTGATSVTFNGTAATFTVVSASEITTTVPTGATTGYVEVTTPGGTLTSNVVYTVKP